MRTGTWLWFVAGAVVAPLAVGGQVQASSPAVVVAPSVALDGDGYVPLTPARLLDTRPSGVTIDGDFQAGGQLTAGNAIELTVLDRGGVPASGVEAVVVQLTSTGATKRSWVSAYAHGIVGPATSNLNPLPGQVRSNLAIVPVGTDGKIDLWNADGAVHLIADVQGWIPSTTTFTPVTPARLLDTRLVGPKMGANSTRVVNVSGFGGVPVGGIGAVAVNLTAVNASVRTWLTAYPSGTTRPGTSNLNANGPAPEANLVIVPVGADGNIELHNALGSVDAIVDVLGWFPDGPGYHPVSPVRAVDTRPGDPLGAGEVVILDTDGVAGVPNAGVGAVVFNITALNSTAPTWISAYPNGAPLPVGSNANPRTTAVTANLVIAKVNADGEVAVRNANGSVDVLLDVVGWLPSDVETADDPATVTEDDAATAVDVLANDVDHDGRPLRIESVDQPANGTVVITGGGTGLTYEPDADYCNAPPGGSPDTFSYHLYGGMSAQVSVTVNCVEDNPVAVDDEATLDEDGDVTVAVRGNDTDVDGGTMDVTGVTQGANGSVAIDGISGNPTYTPEADYCNTPPGTVLDTFTYTLNGGSTATVTVTVNCVDDLPTAVSDDLSVNEDSGANVLTARANDLDVDGGPKLAISVGAADHGATWILDGEPGYTPDEDYCGADEFTYTLNGGSTATISLDVVCIDDASTAVDDSADVTEDSGANTIDVRGNDTDIDSTVELVGLATDPAHGTTALTNAGADLTYTPDANYCGPDSFTYTLSGGSTAAVTVTVTCVDDAPVAIDDEATVAEDAVATAIDVLANDTDVDGGPITVTSVVQPTDGTVVITGGGTGLTYEPNENVCGEDSFTYTLTPGGDTATVTVTVTCVDDFPVPTADEVTVDEDSGATTIDVLANDSDFDGGPMLVISVGDPAGGTAAVTNGGADISYTPDAEFCGDDVFGYEVTGGTFAQVTVHVTCIDDASVAEDDSESVTEDFGPISIDVRGNDTDIDSVVEFIASVTTPTHGVAAVAPGNTEVNYQSDEDYCGPDSFTYTLSGGSTATVSVTVTCVDDAPIANADTLTVDEDAAATEVDVLGNDSDVDGGAIAVDTVSDPAHGTAVLSAGVVTYQPDADYCGPDSFTYSLAPGGSSNTVNVTVNCVDDMPIAVNDDAEVDEDAVDATVLVLANDTDIDAGPKVVTAVSAVTGGTASVAPGGGTVLVTPTADLCGLDVMTFTYEVTGGSTATATVDVNCIDDAPIAVADDATVNEDAPASVIDVLANDTDVDAGPIEIDGFTDPLHGTVAPGVGGTLTYTPDADYCGDDSFEYTILPGGSTATVTITVTCVDDPSVAVADTGSVDQDDGATLIDVLGNDTDVEGDPRIILSVTQPANGDVVIVGLGTGLTYQPDTGYCNTLVGPTTDDFTYTLVGGSSTTVSMTVFCPDTAPTAVPDLAGITEDFGILGIDVLANDTDPDAGPIAVDSVTQPTNGTAAVSGGGTGVSYTPDANYCGEDEFSYTLTPGSSSATVTVTVTCVDDNPVAVGNGATVTEDSGTNFLSVLNNDTDVDGGPISITAVTQPANGTVAITGGGTGVSYQPNANYCNSVVGPGDTFTYTLSPGGSTATVAVTVTCVDDNPIAVADGATVVEDSGATAVDVLANDSDVDGGPVSVTSVTQPANGTVVITGGGTGVTYAPNANYCNNPPGSTLSTFTYTLTPGGSSATVSVTVTCVDDPPTAVNDSVTLTEDAPATAVSVLTNDTDVDAGPISITSVVQPDNGTVVITGGGTGLTYQPDVNYCNTQPGGTADTFTYTLTPGGSTATVSMTVTCVDDPPVAIAHSYSGVANMRIDIPAVDGLLVGAFDVDGILPLSVGTVSATSPAGGVVTHNATDGSFSFTPPPGTTGNVTFTYTVCDSTSPTPVCSANATVTVNVASPVVWFVDDNATPTGANGTLDKPFPSLPAAQAYFTTNSITTPKVFVFAGSYSGNYTMPSGSWLIGQKTAEATSFDTYFGVTPIPYLQARSAIGSSQGTVTTTGTVTLADSAKVRGLVINTSGASGLVGSSATAVSVLDTSVTASAATALSLSSVGGTVTLTSLNTSGAHATSVSIAGTSASVTISAGAITGSTADAFVVDNANGTVTSAATINVAAGRALRVVNRTGGTVSLSGNITTTGGTGILLQSNNSAATTTLTGVLTLSTGANNAFTGSSGGIVQTNASNVGNTITTTSGRAIDLADTTIGANGLIFQSVNVSAATTNGIVLNNTGPNAGLSVVGTGSAGSGGTISGGTVGISLTSTRSPSFTRMVIQNTSGSGIQGTGVTNFSLTNSTITNSGTGHGADTSSVAFNSAVSGTESNVSGTVTITGNTFTTPYYHGVDIKNFAGTLTSVTISTNTITSAASTVDSQGTGIRLQALGSGATASAITAATVANNAVQGFPLGGGILVQGGNAGAGGAVNMGSGGSPLAVTGNTIAGFSAANPMNTHAIAVTVAGNGTGFFNISNNGTVGSPLTNTTGHVMLLAVNGNLAEGTFTVSNNVINGANLGFSNGISGGTGPGADGATATPVMTITATGNNVTNTNGDAILLVARSATGTLRATVQSNTATVAPAGAGYGVRLDAGNASSLGDKVCLTISSNVAIGAGGSTGIGLRLHPTGSPPNLFQITGLSPSPATATQTDAYVEAQNPAGGGATIINSPAGTPFSSCV